MDESTVQPDLTSIIDFEPVSGLANASRVVLKPGRNDRVSDRLTAEEWEKFERDIAEAFEIVD